MPTTDAWTRFEQALADAAPAFADALAPPANPDALAGLARAAGPALAEAAAPLHAHHDGQAADAPGLFFGLCFLSAAEAADEHARWTDLLDTDPDLAGSIPVTSHPDGAVRTVYASRAWLPFATDGAGNALALDLDPGPTGTAGQVISFGPDEPVRHVLAPSPEAFLAACARALESGLAGTAPDPDAPGGLALHIQGASHLFDVLPDWQHAHGGPGR